MPFRNCCGAYWNETTTNPELRHDVDCPTWKVGAERTYAEQLLDVGQADGWVDSQSQRSEEVNNNPSYRLGLRLGRRSRQRASFL